jgi:hypothetical protein
MVGVASALCTQARTGLLPAGTHLVQTSFMASRSLMSDSQICASRMRVLSVPASSSSASIWSSTSWVWPLMSLDRSWATRPAR